MKDKRKFIKVETLNKGFHVLPIDLIQYIQNNGNQEIKSKIGLINCDIIFDYPFFDYMD